MDVLYQDVGGDDDVSPGHQHSSVIARPQEHVVANSQAVRDIGDQLEFGHHQRRPSGRSRASSINRVTSSG